MVYNHQLLCRPLLGPPPTLMGQILSARSCLNSKRLLHLIVHHSLSLLLLLPRRSVHVFLGSIIDPLNRSFGLRHAILDDLHFFEKLDHKLPLRVLLRLLLVLAVS